MTKKMHLMILTGKVKKNAHSFVLKTSESLKGIQTVGRAWVG